MSEASSRSGHCSHISLGRTCLLGTHTFPRLNHWQSSRHKLECALPQPETKPNQTFSIDSNMTEDGLMYSFMLDVELLLANFGFLWRMTDKIRSGKFCWRQELIYLV
jgi:hypothetical protein